MSSNATLKQIQDVFGAINTVPYCSGSVPLDPATSPLFYLRLNNGKAGYIDFAKPTEEQLVALAETCQPATFGRNNEDVLDESYRKAGKMDTSQFSTQFSPLTNGMISTVNSDLLRGRLDSTRKSIRVELYKLNVYGPGSFFKAHVDTPRGANMFGSLVVILPTVHEGGSLILRHGGTEKVFDTAHAVNSQKTPHAAFVAFFSDVEHEVSLVKSGYRVTLTYNLYLTDPTAEALASGPNLDNAMDQRVAELQGLMKNLLQDPTFLPDGGYLGFGLSHQYPFNRSSSSNLGQIADNLKGSDDEVKRVCEALGLGVSLKAVYADDRPLDKYPCCLLDHFFSFDLDDQVDEMELIQYICECAAKKNPLVVYPDGMDLRHQYFAKDNGKPIVWLRQFSKTNSFNSSYLYYGNETSVSTAYGNVCLVVEVAKAADRVH